jgi:hypothetical protein
VFNLKPEISDRKLTLTGQADFGPGITMPKAATLLGVGIVIAAAVASGSNLAQAQNCPRSPDALGTSRVLAIDPREYAKVGAMDGAVALPLSDKEVVLTSMMGHSHAIPTKFSTFSAPNA